MAEPLTLYGMSSPNVRKVVIALEEMGLAYRTRHVAVFRGRQHDEEFLALSPMAKVPVITDPAGPAGDVPIFESGAILVYLAESYAPQFYPAAGPGRWEALEWLMVQVANVGPVLGNHSHFRLVAEEQPYAARRFRHQAAQVFHALERRLGAAPWLGGDAYSIADMATYPWAVRLRRYGMAPEAFPAIRAWTDRIAARPAVERAFRVIEQWGRQDTADRLASTPEEQERFLGLHIPAPSAEDAAFHRGQIEQQILRERQRGTEPKAGSGESDG